MAETWDPAAQAPSFGQLDRPDAGTAGPHALTDLGYRYFAGTSRVYIRLDSEVRYRQRMRGKRLFVVELLNTKVPLKNNLHALDTRYFGGAVTRVQAVPVGANTEIRIQLSHATSWRLRREPQILNVDFLR